MLVISSIEEWWNSLVAKVNSFDRPKDWYIEIALYTLGGFIFGFLLKHYARFLILSSFLTALLLIGLDYYGVISVNYQYLRFFKNLSSAVSIRDLFELAVAWLRGHIAQSIAAGIGFFVAWELC